MKITTLLSAAGAGAAFAYFFDPERGVGRRHVFADRARGALTDVQDLVRKAQRDVENRRRGAEAQASGSQPPREGSRSMFSPGVPERRLAEGGIGVLLAIGGLARGGFIGVGAAVAGAALIARAAKAEPDGMIRVQKTITINAPVEQLFAFWSRFENLPQFMEHVIEVRTEGDGTRSHWRVEGPAGIPIEWDAETTELVPNQRIAWRSIEGSLVDHMGLVRFERLGPTSTRISVHMKYAPPGGALGHTIAGFLGGDPKHLMDDDFIRLRSMFDTNAVQAGSVHAPF